MESLAEKSSLALWFPTLYTSWWQKARIVWKLRWAMNGKHKNRDGLWIGSVRTEMDYELEV